MKKTILYGLLALPILFSAGCKEEEVKTYDGPRSIYFKPIDAGNRYTTRVTYGFGDTNLYEYIYGLDVLATGDVVSYDRHYRVAVADETDAVKGKDYDFPDELIFPAYASTVKFPVTLYRADDGDNGMKSVVFQVEPSEDFNTDVRYMEHRMSKGVPVDVTRMTLDFTSDLPQPGRWREATFGYFSTAKYVLINQLCNLDSDDWANPSGPLTTAWGLVLSNYIHYRLSLGPEEAMKDPNPLSTRGYMTMAGVRNDTTVGMVQSDWPTWSPTE